VNLFSKQLLLYTKRGLDLFLGHNQSILKKINRGIIRIMNGEELMMNGEELMMNDEELMMNDGGRNSYGISNI